MRLPHRSPVWYLRPLHWWQTHVHGEVLEPTALWSYRPQALLTFLAMFSRLRTRRSPVAADLRSLVGLRVSQVTKCAFCIDLNASMLTAAGVTQAKAMALANWRYDAAFSDTERLVLEYAEAVSTTPCVVSDELFERMRASFADEAIVELTAVAAFQNMSARFNAALDAQAHGFCGLPSRLSDAAKAAQ
ncbi:MAG: carboxymuconolactone decarboxylase family protein [Hyphomicrobiaceae bacterium]|nr:carboxymuconolactone decarboxylase family protein [Hyphomicrobiaceae bacterium]